MNHGINYRSLNWFSRRISGTHQQSGNRLGPMSQGLSQLLVLGMGNLQPLMTGILISWGPINPYKHLG